MLQSFSVEELKAFARVKNNRAAFEYASDAPSRQVWEAHKIIDDALKFGTLCETDLITQHKHLPAAEWQDEEQRPREAIDITVTDLGAWSCKKTHVSGDYMMASGRHSCAGCGDSEDLCAVKNPDMSVVRAGWDLPYKSAGQPGYVLFPKRTSTISKVNFILDGRNVKARPNKHLSGRHARILVSLKAEFQTKVRELTDEHFRSYFERIPVFEEQKVLRKKTELCGQVLYNADLIRFNEQGKVEW